MASTTKSSSTITIYRGWKDHGYVWSAFVTKLETRLRFAKLSYKTEAGSPPSGPRGKIPYIEISSPDSEPELMADSSLIIERFVSDGLLPDLNARLSPTEKVYDVALRALLEEKLYFYHGYEKWHENYYATRDHSMVAIPYPIRIVIGMLAYRKLMATFHGQGTGRFSGLEIAGFRENIWSNISTLLVESRKKSAVKDESECFWLLGGEEPTEADATLYGFIIGTLICFAAPTSQKLVRSLPVLEDYARRIHGRYFPDYPRWDEHKV